MNSAPDKLDEIIREAAIRHGYVIGRDDPVLMTYTINQQVMEAGARIQRALLEEHLRDLKKIASELEDQATGRRDRVARQATDSIRVAMRQEAESLFSQQRRESEAAHRLMMENTLQWRRFAGLSVTLSVLTLAAAAIVL